MLKSTVTNYFSQKVSFFKEKILNNYFLKSFLGLLVVGRKRSEEEEFTSTVSFLASDSEECDMDSSKTKWNTVDVKVNSTKVFVWGLNDKDQLGGQKVRTSLFLFCFNNYLDYLKFRYSKKTTNIDFFSLFQILEMIIMHFLIFFPGFQNQIANFQ